MNRALLFIASVGLVVGGIVWYEYKDSTSQSLPIPYLPTENQTITVTTPRPHVRIQSPVLVTGNARGMWFFEGSFPVKVYDADGQLLGEGHAQASTDWMTENFVPFTGAISFSQPKTPTGVIRLQNDNPSGLPANDKHTDIPVSF